MVFHEKYKVVSWEGGRRSVSIGHKVIRALAPRKLALYCGKPGNGFLRKNFQKGLRESRVSNAIFGIPILANHMNG